MFVGVVKMDFHFPACRSLKDKRHFVRQIKGQLLSKFTVVASEVGFLDKWQRSEIGFAIVGNDQRRLDSLIDKVLSFLEMFGGGQLLSSQKEIVSV